MVKTSALLAIALVVLLVAGILFWPTLYRYEQISRGDSNDLVRIHRVTGRAETLRRGLWESATDLTPEPLPEHRLRLVTGRAELTGGGHFAGRLYNGSGWTIWKLTVEIVAAEADGRERWTRLYQTRVSIRPFTSVDFSVPVSDDAGALTKTWHIERADGTCDLRRIIHGGDGTTAEQTEQLLGLTPLDAC